MTFDFSFNYEFDHIGIAVESIEKAGEFYQKLGFSNPDIEEVVSEQVKVAMYHLANKSKIELLEATSESSPIYKFLKKKGPGIHHICLRVENIRAILDELKRTDIKLLNPEPKSGAHGSEVVFIHPKSAGGVLVELSQLPEESK